MKFSVTVTALAAAMGANALPSGHVHGHKQAHRSLAERDDAGKFVQYNQPAPVPAPATQEQPAPQPEPTQEEPKKEDPPAPKEDNKPKPSGSSGSGGQGISEYTPFCSGKSKRATAADIAYKGNLGNGEYGCNLMLAQKEAAQEYDYKLQLKNVGDEVQTCTCFLKIGPDGGINGSWKDKELFKFQVPVGDEQWVVADEDTQGICACIDGEEMAYTSFGQTAATWAEFDFANARNKWSGADASCLTASRENLKIPGMKICSPQSTTPCSIIYPGGTGSNAFLKGMEAEDGWGIQAQAGPVTLNVEIGYSG